MLLASPPHTPTHHEHNHEHNHGHGQGHSTTTTTTPTTTSSSSSSKRKDKNKRNKQRTNNLIRTIYCPTTETTYEGEIRLNHTTLPKTSTLTSTLSTSTSPLFIKHGKGTIHNHKDNTTLVGFFQHNQIVGHALQTFYDRKGNCAIAQYEGSFITPELYDAELIDTNKKMRKNKSKKNRSHTTTSTSTYNNNNNNNESEEKKKEQYEKTNNTNDNNNKSIPISTFTFEYLRHGFGKYSWPFTNDEYVGEFHLGTMHGKGTFTWGSTGDRYTGLWSKGKMHGLNGIKQTTSGEEFTGTFVKGRATGWGRKVFACGDIHDGMYRKDKRHGFGLYKWISTFGDQYIGQWQYGRMVGRGVKSLVYTPERGRERGRGRVRGDNNHGQNHGYDYDYDTYGVHDLRRGDLIEVFHGLFVNDKAQGYGVKYYACGDMYCGQYKDDMRDTYGVYTWSNGERYSGQWIGGRMCGIGVKCMVNGDTYDGQFLNDEAYGFGVKTFGSTGDIHFGEYQNNLRWGKGLYRWSNGDEYEGNYVQGEQCGFGCYRWNNGTMTFDGRWLNGQKHGPGFLRIIAETPTNISNYVVSERVFFEVWSKGNRVFRQVIDFAWKNLPDMEDLPQYHNWKHVWETEETSQSENQNQISYVRSENTTVPMLEGANTTLEPFADEAQQEDALQPQVSFIQDNASTLDTQSQPRARQRHYSVDFYSFVPEERNTHTKPRSSSFSSYLNSTESHSRCRKGRFGNRRIHHSRGGFVVMTTIRKKTRISRLFPPN